MRPAVSNKSGNKARRYRKTRTAVNLMNALDIDRPSEKLKGEFARVGEYSKKRTFWHYDARIKTIHLRKEISQYERTNFHIKKVIVLSL